MATKYGRFGADSNWNEMADTSTRPYDMNVSPALATQEYPVQIVMAGLSYYNGFYCSEPDDHWMQIYLSDTTGTIQEYLGSVGGSGAIRDYDENGRYTWNIPAAQQKKFKGKRLCLIKKSNIRTIYYRGGDAQIIVTTNSDEYNVSISNTTGGTAGASTGRALVGSTVTLSATPSAGYELSGWTSTPSLTITGNSFTMPESDVTITPVWVKKPFSIIVRKNIAEAGSVTCPATGVVDEEITVSQTTNAGYEFAGWTLSNGASVSPAGKFTMPPSIITVTANYTRKSYAITKVSDPAAGGEITVPATGQTGLDIAISQAPATGYTFNHWTLSTGVPVTGNKFRMPAQPVTITATYTRNVYSITAETIPAGAGVITCAGSAGYNDEITVSQTPAAGYYFNGWTLSSGGSVTGGKFNMPNGDVIVRASYLRRSEAVVGNTTMQGGAAWSFSFTSENAAYTHRWRIVFPGKVTQEWQNVAAGQTNNSISCTIPAAWAASETGADRMTGGELQLETYSGSTLIGTHVTGALVYMMPADAAPGVTATVTRNLSAEGVTYADADCYVQNHSGVRVVATGTTMYQATIASIRIRMIGYTGNKFDRTFTTFSSGSCTFDSGILANAGTNTIEITITDSRGLSYRTTQAITVEAYVSPTITAFDVWRVDGTTGDADETGEYAKFSADYRWTAVGTNAVTRSITAHGTTQNVTTDEDWIFPGTHEYFPALYTAMVNYTVKDRFETASITVRLDTRRFIMHFSADGTSAAFGHAVQETPTAGSRYTGTFEIDDSMEPYIGNMTLKEYILAVVNGTI